MPSSLEASAIVCTLDRGPAIVETVESLLGQQEPSGGGGFEILLVDNASKPENARILTDLAASHRERVRYVREAEVGESAARNCAVREARGRIHAHIDDDAVAEPGWLRALCAPFADESVGGVGGFIGLRYDSRPPDWVDASLTPYLSAFDAGAAPKDLHYPDYPRGANMAFRASVFERAGKFSTTYGRKGSSLLSYSETEMYWRIERAGYRIVYAPDARIDHIVPARRLTHEWFRDRIYWQGRSIAKFDREHHGIVHMLLQLPRHYVKGFTRPQLHRALHTGYMSGALRALVGG